MGRRKENELDIFGIGQCALDYIGRIAGYPPADTKCEFHDLAVDGGGPASTALVALARWGFKCGLAGITGDDAFGFEIRRLLVSEGIDIENVLIRPGARSQFAFIAAEEDGGRRTIFWQRPTGIPPRAEEIPIAAIADCRAVHVDGLFPEASVAACREAQKKGKPVFVDAGSWREGMADIARSSDYFIASETCGSALSGGGPPLDACRRILEFGPRLAAVTLGERGYAAMTSSFALQKPAYPVTALDTTGCGDVFHAGFIYGILRGLDVEQSLDIAAWAASRVSLKLGGRGGIPSLSEMEEHIEQSGPAERS